MNLFIIKSITHSVTKVLFILHNANLHVIFSSFCCFVCVFACLPVFLFVCLLCQFLRSYGQFVLVYPRSSVLFLALGLVSKTNCLLTIWSTFALACERNASKRPCVFYSWSGLRPRLKDKMTLHYFI